MRKILNYILSTSILLFICVIFFVSDSQAQSCRGTPGDLIQGAYYRRSCTPTGCDPSIPAGRPGACTSCSDTCSGVSYISEDCRDYSSAGNCSTCVSFNFTGYPCGNKGRCQWQGSTTCSCAPVGGCGANGCSPRYKYFQGNNCSNGNGCYFVNTCPAPTVPPNAPTSTPIPTATPVPPACTPGEFTCGPPCRSCNAQGQWYDNASNGCYGGGDAGFARCECLRGQTQYCVSTPEPAAPTPTTAPNPTTVPPQNCSPTNTDCENNGGTWTCDGNSCSDNNQCGGGMDWCYSGCCCRCSTQSAPPTCTSSTVDCGGFEAQRLDASGLRISSVKGVALNSGETVQTLIIQPNDKVRFTGPNWTGGTIEYNNYIFSDGGTTTNCSYGLSGIGGNGGCSENNNDPDGTWVNIRRLEKRFSSGTWTVKNSQQSNCAPRVQNDQEANPAAGRNRCVLNISTCDPISAGAPHITVNGQNIADLQWGAITDATTANISWPVVAGAAKYLVRIDEFDANDSDKQSWSGTCSSVNSGDVCDDNASVSISNGIVTYTPSTPYSFQAGKNYHIWIHGVNNCNQNSAITNAYVSYEPKGAIIQASCNEIIGWACDLDNATNPTGTPGSYQIKIHFYETNAAGTSNTKLDEEAIANETAIVSSAQCAENGNHGFNIDVPAKFKDGGTHYLHAYALNIGVNARNTRLSSSPLPIQLTGCADPWIKLKDASYINTKTTAGTNPIPQNAKKYDDGSISDTSTFIEGTNTAGVSSGIKLGNFGATYSSPTNWADSTQNYTKTGTLDRAQFTEYIKSRKNYKTIADIAEINADGIYILSNPNYTITTVPQYNFVLIAPNQVTIQMSADTFNQNSSKSVAILAEKITFANSITYAKGIFIADTIETGLHENRGLKIEGNIVATNLNNQRKWTSLQTRPTIYIVHDVTQYITLLPYLSTSSYDWKEIQ